MLISKPKEPAKFGKRGALSSSEAPVEVQPMTPSVLRPDDAFEDLSAALEWGSQLDLSDEQRNKLAGYCCKIAGILTSTTVVGIPSWRLAEEAEGKAKVVEYLAAIRRKMNGSA
jgi:hypothetical protein